MKETVQRVARSLASEAAEIILERARASGKRAGADLEIARMAWKLLGLVQKGKTK